MPRLEPFQPVTVAGSHGASYEVTRKADHIYCTCPSWKFMRAPIQARHCKHILALLGGTSSSPVASRAPAASTPSKKRKREEPALEPDLEPALDPALAEKWTTQDPTGWYRSEKLDGMRCIWTGSRLLSRNHLEIHAPPELLAELPPLALDGELFLGRGRFQECMSVVRSHAPDRARWREVRFMVFDAPQVAGAFDQRIATVEVVLRGCAWARPLPQTLCTGAKDVRRALDKVLAAGGEGLVLRHPSHLYQGGRTTDLLKVKVMQDAEATVVGHEEGTGRNRQRLGALICADARCVFKVGTGFPDAMRDDPPAIGTRITYQFQERLASGKPRFPVFVRVRPSE